MHTAKTERAGVIALPPLIYLGFLAAGAALEYLVPTDTLPEAVQFPLGIAFSLIGAAIMPFVLPLFRKAGTPFDVRKPATALITGGAFRFSRDPAYLALTLLYAGIAIAADSIWVLGLLIPTVVIMHYGVIRPEERHLESRFGEEYLRYKRAVRRWL